MNNSLAIIYFSRHARSEARHKIFCSGPAALNLKIAQQLYRHSLKEICKTNLPFFCFTEEKQKGSTFSERLANAFQEVFEAGYTSAIAVGSDTPGLDAAQILQAATGLHHSPVVAGSTFQGGVYLFGMEKKSFNRKLFNDLPWQTASLSARLQQIFPEILLLPALSEINTEQHLKVLTTGPQKINKIFLQLLSFISSFSIGKYNSVPTAFQSQVFCLRQIPGRAP